MAQDQLAYRRATNAAIVGLCVQIVFAAVLGIVASYSQCPAFYFATFECLGGLPIWVILIMLFHQHRLESAEALEAEQLARADAATAAIFDEHGVDLQIARRRLNALYKWGLGSVSVLVSAYLILMGAFLAYITFLSYRGSVAMHQPDAIFVHAIGNPTANDGVLLAISVGIFFLAFIIARYEAGMAKLGEWQLLRGGASFLMGNFVIMVMIAVGMIAVLLGNQRVLALVGIAIPLIMILLGIEIILMLLLGAYRPRLPGEVPRPAFDSRLLGIFTSPKSLAKALGEAINYQFGFEVSRSWFYQLLGQAITPLVAFGILVLLAMSTIVIVAPQQEAIILRNGRIVSQVGPGLHFKWPWPIGAVQTEDVGRLQEMSLGSATKGLDETKAILWTNAHAAGEAKEEYLVAAPTPLDNTAIDLTNPEQVAGLQEAQATPGISLVGLQIQILYRVNASQLEEYLRSCVDPHALLTDIAERQLNAYLVTQDIDSLIGPARITGGEVLRKAIQAEVNANHLGISVVFVGMIGVHPPSDKNVAGAFHEQIDVLQESETKKERARSERITMLVKVVGSEQAAMDIKAKIDGQRAAQAELDQLRKSHAASDVIAAKVADEATREAQIEELLASAKGDAATTIYEARAYRWERTNIERAKAERFEAQLAAFRLSPQLYRMRRYLEVLTNTMVKPRKYVLVTHDNITPTMRIDLKDAGNALQDVIKSSE